MFKVDHLDSLLCREGVLPVTSDIVLLLNDEENIGGVQSNELHRLENKKLQYQCTLCDKSYDKLSFLLSHQRTHRENKPFICPFPNCPSRFTERTSLKSHIKRHTGERPFPCLYENCERAFITKQCLEYHVNTHLEIRAFLCSTCGCSFDLKPHLVTHQRKYNHH